MAYVRAYASWKDYPDTSTPITAAMLQHIEDGIYGLTSGTLTFDTLTVTAPVVPAGDLVEVLSASSAKLVWVDSGGSLYMGGTIAAAASVAPPFRFDLPNQKLYLRGVIIGDIADTGDLGLRRAEGTDAAPTKVTASTTIARIYVQSYGDNGPFGSDFDTPTAGQHQAAVIASVAQQDASYFSTTVNGAVTSGATSITLTAVTGLPSTGSGGGQIYVQASDGTYLTVVYTTLTGSVLSGCTGITKNVNNAANAYAFQRGTDLEFYTTPNGQDGNLLRMTIDQNGLVRMMSDSGSTALHIKSANTGIRMSAGASSGSPEWMLNKVATNQWTVDCDDLTFRTTGANVKFRVNSTGVGFYTTAPVAKQTVTGSRGGNAALASLLTALATSGLITDSTTA